MENMEKLVKKHNSNLLRKNDTDKRNLNSRTNNTCIWDGKRFSSNIVYSAEVFIGNKQNGDKYFGICKTEFKTKLGNHQNSFKNSQKEKDTELPKYISNLKDKGIFNYRSNKVRHSQTKWSIDKQTSGYNIVTNFCILCLSDKLVICNFRDKDHLTNKHMDLVSKCRHENKFIWSN